MKTYILAGGLTLAAMASPVAAAITVDFSPGAGVPAGFTVFQNFDSLAAGSSLGTNAKVYANSVPGTAARPAFGSTGNFASVNTGGSAVFSFAPTNVFGFTLGSLDTFNAVTFLFSGGTTQTLTGGQLVNGPTANGNQVAPATNGFVKYSFTGPALVGATFLSTGTAFEFDNLAATAVPEPAAWALMLLGFGAVGGLVRRRAAVTSRIRFA